MMKAVKNMIPKKMKAVLNKVLKKKYRNKDYADSLMQLSNELLKERLAAEKKIPVTDLQQKHIQNLKVIVNRQQLLQLLPQNAVCAEIGVDKADFSEIILDITHPQKLHLVDAWGDPSRYHDGLKLAVHEKFKEEIQNDKVAVHVGFSTVVLKTFPDNYFDWAYLDTDHSYKTTADELQILKNKIKPGGIIAGHDYIIGNWVGAVRYGVMEAVHEFCLKENWELLYITINKSEMPSFAIQKLNS